jgi:hypothetical protein
VTEEHCIDRAAVDDASRTYWCLAVACGLLRFSHRGPRIWRARGIGMPDGWPEGPGTHSRREHTGLSGRHWRSPTGCGIRDAPDGNFAKGVI